MLLTINGASQNTAKHHSLFLLYWAFMYSQSLFRPLCFLLSDLCPPLVMIGLLVPFCLHSADSLVVSIPEGIDRIGYEEVQKKQRVLFDRDGTYDIAQLLSDTEVPWQVYTPKIHRGAEYYGWTKTAFRNDGSKPRHDYLFFSALAQIASVYLVRETGMEAEVRGRELQSIPGLKGAMALYLAPQESVTIYYRGRFSNFNESNTMYSTHLVKDSYIMQRRTNDFGRVYLYLGVLLCLLVFSGLLLLFFRQYVLIFFGTMLIGFAGYFYFSFAMTGILPSLSSYEIPTKVNLSVPIIYLGISGFIVNYLDVRKRFPQLYPWYLLTSACVVMISLAFAIPAFRTNTFVKYVNIAALFWAFFTIAFVVIAARKGGRSVLILLISFGVLFVAAAVFIVGIVLNLAVDLRYFFMWSTLALSIMILYGIYDKLTAGIRENQRLTDQQRFRTRFFANITHEFRTPLTLILGPIKQLLEKSKDSSERELLAIADRNARRQLHLVNQILDLSRTEASRSILEAMPVDLVLLLRRLTTTYDSLATQREISLAFTTESSELVVYAEAAKLETILYNLLTNAFKFTPRGGAITVLLEASEDTAFITVRDTGNGIPSNALPFVFNRFYTDTTNAEAPVDSSGIGLALSRELVLLHGGTIEVSSEPKVRTDFRIGLPYQQGLEAVSLVNNNEEIDPLLMGDFEDLEEEVPPGKASPEKAPLVLIVEDNADMRTYLSRGLEGTYRVCTAPNGREGVELARRLTPDLVVSDIMMPEMNGFELCLDLKTEITTSHIPVILLTARSASRDRLHGLDTGADDYLVKPFEVKELLARTRNLIRSREQLRELFASSIVLKPSEVTATPVDRQFLTAAIQAVEDHIDDESFDIDQLAQQLAMSRTSLNRKFRALINQSSNHFIRGVRLERAADLLLKTDDTVAIIADKTGFGSATYFIKSFREKFGTTPGGYRKEEE
jgi:signal transduction histidine kinase/DNA-binding response OmpR family regulator